MGPDGPASAAAWNRLLAPREPGPVSPVPSGLAVQKQLPISEHEYRKYSAEVKTPLRQSTTVSHYRS
eukprot:scaffold31013_cov110-Isochrysis_galbana.AAC.5